MKIKRISESGHSRREKDNGAGSAAYPRSIPAFLITGAAFGTRASRS